MFITRSSLSSGTDDDERNVWKSAATVKSARPSRISSRYKNWKELLHRAALRRVFCAMEEVKTMIYYRDQHWLLGLPLLLLLSSGHPCLGLLGVS